jgi:hypothetical protein
LGAKSVHRVAEMVPCCLAGPTWFLVWGKQCGSYGETQAQGIMLTRILPSCVLATRLGLLQPHPSLGPTTTKLYRDTETHQQNAQGWHYDSSLISYYLCSCAPSCFVHSCIFNTVFVSISRIFHPLDFAWHGFCFIQVVILLDIFTWVLSWVIYPLCSVVRKILLYSW